MVKKLRRRDVRVAATANAFLEAEYWPEHNRRFAPAAASADDFHVGIPRGVRLDDVFRLEEKRTVSNDWVVRYDNRFLQLERQSHRPPARSTVLVYDAVDGQIEIRYRDRVMRWQEVAAETLTAKRATAPAAWQAPAPPEPAPSRVHGRRPSVDHPWRRGFEARAQRRTAPVLTP